MVSSVGDAPGVAAEAHRGHRAPASCLVDPQRWRRSRPAPAAPARRCAHRAGRRPVQQLGPLLVGRGAAPRREAPRPPPRRPPRRRPRCLGRVADDLLGGRVDDLVGAVAALDPLAADQQPVRAVIGRRAACDGPGAAVAGPSGALRARGRAQGSRSSPSSSMALPRTSLRTRRSGEVAHELHGDLLGVRPGAVRVRVVGLERDVVDADLARGDSQAVRVVEEAAEDLRGSSRSTAARAPCRRRRPTPGCPPRPCRPARGCTGSSPIWPSEYASLRSGNCSSTPDMRKSVIDIMALMNVSVEPDRGRRVRRRRRHLRRRADVHVDDRAGLGARREERVPVARSGSTAGPGTAGSR